MPENHYPLTRPQEFIWNDQMVYRELPWYNIGGYDILKGPLNTDALVKALELTIDHNQSFKLVFGEENGIGVRSAVGMMLPSNIAVEIEAVFELKH